MIDIRYRIAASGIQVKFGRLLFTAIALFALTAPQAAEPHWTRGTVKKVVLGAELKDVDKRECVRDLPHEAMLTQSFVVVNYPHGRQRWAKTVALPSGMSLIAGEAVRIDLTDCSVDLQKLDDASTKK